MRIIRIVIFVLFLAACVFAQKGVVSGSVFDEQGAVIPGIQIEFISEKGRTFSASTNAAGEYRLELESGLYKVIAFGRPFTEVTFANYWVPQRSLRLDIALRCIDCKVLNCPVAEFPLVETTSIGPMIVNEIQSRPLEKLSTATTSKEKTIKKTKKNK